MSVCCCPGSNSVHIQGMMITLPSYFFGVHITDLATVAAVHLRCRGVANHDRLGHLRHDRLACQGLNLRKTDLVVLSLLLQLFNKHSWRGRFLCFVVFLCVIQDNEFDNNRARLNSCHQHLVLRAVKTVGDVIDKVLDKFLLVLLHKLEIDIELHLRVNVVLDNLRCLLLLDLLLRDVLLGWVLDCSISVVGGCLCRLLDRLLSLVHRGFGRCILHRLFQIQVLCAIDSCLVKTLLIHWLSHAVGHTWCIALVVAFHCRCISLAHLYTLLAALRHTHVCTSSGKLGRRIVLVRGAISTFKALLAEACAIVASAMIGAVFGTNARTAVIRSPADIALANTSGALPIATAGIFARNLAATWACPR